MRLKSWRIRSSYSSSAGLPEVRAPTRRSRSAPAEKLPSAAGHDRHPQLGVAVEEVPGVAEEAEDLGVEGVLLGGAVEREGQDVAVALDEDCGI